MSYNWEFGALIPYWFLFLKGTGVTLAYAIGSIILGLLIGAAVGIAQLSRRRPVLIVLGAYVELFRCTPLLVQIVWFYYAFPILLGIEMQAWAAALTALSLYAGAFYAEVFRGGLESIEPGQWDAAKALNMSTGQTIRRIILPQAVKRMIAPFMNQSVLQLKNTSLISTIAVADVIYQGTVITAAIYRPFEVYTTVAAIYFAILFPVTLLARRVENKLDLGARA